LPGPAREFPLEFPEGGVDRTCEFSRQPAGTAPSAANVRAFDATGRKRGGSRSGLSKYVNERVNGNSVIQHLACIVDPTTAALSVNDIAYGLPTTTLSNGSGGGGPAATTYVREGGSADQPNVEVEPEMAANPDAGDAIVFVRQDTQGFPDASGELDFVFGATPTNGSLLVIVVLQSHSSDPGAPSVRNAVEGAYTQAGSSVTFTKLGATRKLSIFYRNASAGTDENTVTVDQESTTAVVAGLVYTGVVSTSPLDAVGAGTSAGNAATMTAGETDVNSRDALVLAAFAAALAPDTVTPSAGYTLRVNHDDGGVDGTDLQLYVTDKIGADWPDPETPQATFAGGADDYCALPAVFKD
jgi:hypothetical protein